MKQLPFEILNKIFLYLHPRDNVDCMLVCQHWKQVIEKSALYHALYVSSAKSLEKVTKMVKENPDIGKKVEHLTTSLVGETDDFDMNKILLLLPNLRTLTCAGHGWADVIIVKNTIYSWSEHIESIYEHAFGSVTHSLLSSNICPNLTTVDGIDAAGDFIPLLKNAPNLRNLSLCTGSITFDDLDTIHESVPYLESLSIHGLILVNSELSQNVNPATSVTECHFNKVFQAPRSWKTRVDLLVYASRKYPNLSKFTYTFYPGGFNNDHIETLTDSDWFPFLQNLGPRLKKLCLCNYGWADNTFEILDRFNCQIEYLEISKLSDATLMKVIQSQQISYIQTLSLLDTDVGTYGWLRELQALRKLKICLSSFNKFNTDIGLNTILDNSPPTLKSLSLFGIRLAAVPRFTDLSNMVSLTFSYMEIPKGIDTFISQCLPKLSNLKLRKCKVIGDAFNLEKLDLLNFAYITPLNNGGTNILIVTSGDKERRWYSIRDAAYTDFEPAKKYGTFYIPVKSWPQNETDTEPHFTLLCNSLNNCIFI